MAKDFSGLASARLRVLANKYMKYLENIESSSSLTLRAYRLDLGQAFPGIWEPVKNAHPESLQDLDLLRTARLALHRWGNLSSASRNRKSSTLKSFFGYLFREGFLESDLASQIHSPKVAQKIPHFISVDEMLSALKSFDDEKPTAQRRQEKLMFLLLYGTGLRVSEACHLQWKHIDLVSRTLRIKGKGGNERLVAIPRSVQVLLKPSLKEPGPYVWGGQPLSSRKAYDWVRSRGVKAGLLRPIHPHALRHSFATHLLSSGANLRTLQELLGHKSLAATEKYTHLGVDQLARTLEKHHPFGRKK